MSGTAINRSLGNVRTELDFLLENKVISKDFYNEFSNRLPQKWDSKQDTSKKFMEAIYNYEPQQSSDLRLNVGDKVEILETLSESWLKGKCNGKVGVFPSNYVKPVDQPYSSRPMQPLPSQPHNSNDEKHQLEQQRKQREKDEQKRQRDEEKRRRDEEERRRKDQEAQRIQQQQQMQQQQQQHQQQQQPQKKHNSSKFLNKFGSRLGNAVIWGAGSRIGSDLVNSAFNKLND
ncbi:[PSI+] inducibility protein 3 [Monosporozyma servazzii]